MVTQSSTGSSRSSATSVAASAGIGVVAAAIGYSLTYLLIGSEVRAEVGEGVADWKVVAWHYYNAHMVDVEASGAIGSFGGSSTVDFIAQSGSTSATLLYVVPPLVLIGAGMLLARQWDVADIGEAVVVGTPITIGYAVVMGLGAVAAEASSESSFFGIEVSGSIGPELGSAIVLGGILYPLVFATGGAVLAAVLGSR